KFSDDFFASFFEAVPTARMLFNGKLRQVQWKLVKMIGSMMSSKESAAQRKKSLEELAALHGKRGVHPNQYAPFSVCLFETIKKRMGDYWTEEQENSWTALISSILHIMVPTAVQQH
ncbi:unnamed protein product, partial [Heterosigma akashiwo]